MSNDPYTRFRALCLAMPAAEELVTWGHPTYRVKNKIFASLGASEAGVSMSVKATKDEQAELLKLPGWQPAHYVGQHGWCRYDFGDHDDWALLEARVRRAWALTAPKRLVNVG